MTTAGILSMVCILGFYAAAVAFVVYKVCTVKQR